MFSEDKVIGVMPVFPLSSGQASGQRPPFRGSFAFAGPHAHQPPPGLRVIEVIGPFATA